MLSVTQAKKRAKAIMAMGVVAVALLSAGGAVLGQGGVEAREEGARIRLRTEQMTVMLGKAEKGAVVSLTDNATGQEFVIGQKEPCLFRLVFTKKGDVSGTAQTFSSRDAREVTCSATKDATAAVATLDFKAIGGKGIDATCRVSVREGDPLIYWRISVSGQEPMVLEEVRFPIVLMKDALGKAVDDDAAIAGATEDGLLLAPGKWPVGHRRQYAQPGSLCAQFGCYLDATAGFFTATQDGKGYPKRLAMARTADGLEFTWSHLCYHELGKPFGPDYDVVCSTFRSEDGKAPADWRDGADIYKAWALTQPWCAKTVVQRQDIPEWLKRGCACLLWELRTDGAPDAVVEWLDRCWEKHFAPLPPLVTVIGFEHVADWVAPKYFPFYPSDEAFQAAAQRIAKMGGHVFLFPSSYQWSLTYNKRGDGGFDWDDLADFDKVGRPHAVVNRDGTVFTCAYSWLKGGESAALCRGDAWSRAFLADTMTQLVKRGVDVIQMDQVVGGRWPNHAEASCFSQSHGHPPGYGLWDTEAYHDQMKALRQRCDEVRPQVAFSEEAPQELFAQDFELFDYRHDRASVNVKLWELRAPKAHAPVFPYLYHEFVPVLHIPTHTEPVAIILAHAIVSGEVPSFKRAQIEFPGDAVVENSGFEGWAQEPLGWRIWRSRPEGAAKVCMDGNEKRAGRLSLRLENDRDDETVQAYQCLPVDDTTLGVGKTYRVRVSLKSEGLAGTGGVFVEALDSLDWRVWKQLGAWAAEAPADTDWKEVAVTCVLPPGSQNLCLNLRLKGKGKVWFDDLRLETVREDGAVAEAVRPGNAVFHMLRQWSRLVSDGAGKYLLLGRMLHPPPLQTERLKYAVPVSEPADLKFSLYTLRADGSGTGGYVSCPLPIAAKETPWEQRVMEYTIEPGAAELHVPLSLREKGEILFDDFALTEAGGQENLLRNGGFEDWQDASAAPPGWARIEEYQGRRFTGKICREDTDKHGGSFAIRLVNATGDDTAHAKQVLPVDGKRLSVGKRYRLSFWTKVRNVARWKPVSVEREFPAILHNAFRAPDGGEAVIAVNITNRPQTGALRWRGRETELKLSPWEVILLKE